MASLVFYALHQYSVSDFAFYQVFHGWALALGRASGIHSVAYQLGLELNHLCVFRGAWRTSLLSLLSSGIWIGLLYQCVGVIRDKKNIRALAFTIEKTGERGNTILGGNSFIRPGHQREQKGRPPGTLEQAGLSLFTP